MAKTNIGLVAYAKAQLGRPYWYGTFGQKSTANLLSQKAKQYPTQYSGSRVKTATAKHLGVKVHDCVGLIKGYLWCDSATDDTPKYNANQDKSANGMYNACKERGYIDTLPELAGVLVFFDGHVGVYIGNGEVIEARGFDYGVVKTKLSARPWTRWGKCPYITYTTATSPTTGSSATVKKTIEEVAKAVILGEYGDGAARVKALKADGYDPAAVQKKVNELLKASKSDKPAPKIGDRVEITGKYASSSEAKNASNKKAIGSTAYIVKIYDGKAFPYQLGTKKGNTTSANTIGFAKASAFELV